MRPGELEVNFGDEREIQRLQRVWVDHRGKNNRSDGVGEVLLGRQGGGCEGVDVRKEGENLF